MGAPSHTLPNRRHTCAFHVTHRADVENSQADVARSKIKKKVSLSELAVAVLYNLKLNLIWDIGL